MIKRVIEKHVKKIFEERNWISDSDYDEDLYDIARAVSVDLFRIQKNIDETVDVYEIDDVVDDLYQEVKTYLSDKYSIFSFCGYSKLDSSYERFYIFYLKEDIQFSSVKAFDDYFALCICDDDNANVFYE